MRAFLRRVGLSDRATGNSAHRPQRRRRGDGLWIFGFGRCHADAPVHGRHTSDRSGPMIVADYYLQPAGRAERDIVPGRDRHPNSVPDDQRHPAADRSGGATAPGWNIWFNGDIAYFKFQNSSADFPATLGSRSPALAGRRLQVVERLASRRRGHRRLCRTRRSRWAEATSQTWVR